MHASANAQSRAASWDRSPHLQLLGICGVQQAHPLQPSVQRLLRLRPCGMAAGLKGAAGHGGHCTRVLQRQRHAAQLRRQPVHIRGLRAEGRGRPSGCFGQCPRMQMCRVAAPTRRPMPALARTLSEKGTSALARLHRSVARYSVSARRRDIPPGCWLRCGRLPKPFYAAAWQRWLSRPLSGSRGTACSSGDGAACAGADAEAAAQSSSCTDHLCLPQRALMTALEPVQPAEER